MKTSRLAHIPWGWTGFVAFTLGMLLMLIGQRPAAKDASEPGLPPPSVSTSVGQGMSIFGATAYGLQLYLSAKQRARAAAVDPNRQAAAGHDESRSA